MFPGKINVNVRVGDRTVQVGVDSRVTVGQVKDKVAGMVGVEGDKMRLKQGQGLAMKDGFTLAFYNIPEGGNLAMVPKK